MKERWLQTLWGRQDWNEWPLRTCQGESIHVLDPGRWNNDQGPDFLQAKIFIGQILWVGSIEIHIHTTDWYRHRHSHDPNYLPVVLHVVWMKGPIHPDVPTLELSRFLTIPTLKRTLSFLNDIEQLPCARYMRPVPTETWFSFRKDLLASRHYRKRFYERNAEELDLRSRLSKQMGAWVNREVFESINASISNALLERIQADPELLIAVYLGQGALLQGDLMSSQLFTRLGKIYSDLRMAHSLNPPYRQLLWMRIRPNANPVKRLIQLACLVNEGWHRQFKWEIESPESMQVQLSTIYPPAIIGWEARPLLSASMVQSLLINIWSYVNAQEVNALEKSLMQFDFEQNRFTRLFQPLELKEVTAADSQALLELHHLLCDKGKCRECRLANCWGQPQAPQSM